jgi:hypothetical protein
MQSSIPQILFDFAKSRTGNVCCLNFFFFCLKPYTVMAEVDLVFIYVFQCIIEEAAARFDVVSLGSDLC